MPSKQSKNNSGGDRPPKISPRPPATATRIAGQDTQCQEPNSYELNELNGRPTEMAHVLLGEHVSAGDRVVDATIGNGHDSFFLANLVGPTGHVDGFDLQDKAVESTRQKLADLNASHVSLHAIGHQQMADFVKKPVQAVMFNLGYLPGGDKQVITLPDTTVAALQSATKLLLSGGIVTIVAYTGHPGGQEEAHAVTAFCQSLAPKQFTTTIYKSPSGNPAAPFLMTIVRRQTMPQ